jgi:DNA-binding transcriptional MerR regulator
MSWMIWPGNPALSAIVLFLIALPFLYAARRPLQGLIRALTRALSQPLRLAARWVNAGATELKARNKQVLLAHGREEAMKLVDREFERVTAIVQRDLQGYPALQRKLMDEITKIEEDYQKCGEVPPPPPEWTKAVSAMAAIKPSGDGLVERILADISQSIDEIYDKVTAEYRRAYEERHKILKGFQPFWRSLGTTLAKVDKSITGLQNSAAKIDSEMEKVREIHAKLDRAEHSLAASQSMQFAISGLVMLIAIGGAFVNFKLISLPMSAMVGGGDYITENLQASEVAALVVILFETLMGLFLMESLRLTHLFPLSNISEKMRRGMMWASLVILLVLAGFEAALAVMRDQIVAADLALKQALGSSTAVAAAVEAGWVTKIPAFGQMILGFTLPFALAFVAIPLEYFIQSGRTVLGSGVVLGMRTVALLLRSLAGVFRHIGTALCMLYDAVIFLPLLIERMIVGRRGGQGALPSGGGRAEVAAFPKRSSATGEHG